MHAISSFKPDSRFVAHVAPSPNHDARIGTAAPDCTASTASMRRQQKNGPGRPGPLISVICLYYVELLSAESRLHRD